MGCILSTTAKQGNQPVPAIEAKKPTIRAGAAELKQLYNIGKILGSGSFGKVFLGENKADTELKVAIKVISKSNLSKEEIDSLHVEVSILQKVDHPSIVKYYETYEDEKFIYLVMELCPGGELIDKIVDGKSGMSENMAAEAIDKILRALIHCHK